MNNRVIITHLGIVIGICGALWILLIKPTIEECNKLDRQIHEADANSQVVSEYKIEQLAGKLHQIKQRVIEISTFNELTRDTSHLYGIIMEQAARHHIHIKRLDPGLVKPNSDKQKPYEVTTFDMSIEGELANVMNFIDGISRIDCFLRPLALNITPITANKSAYVQARLACEALYFVFPQTLAKMADQNDAE